MPKWAKAGVVLIGVAVIVAMLYPVFMGVRDGVSPNHQCLANVKNLAVAVTMYVTDYDRTPDPRAWSDRLMEYVRNPDVFRCPEAPELGCAYAFNDGASGVTEKSLAGREAARLVTIFESDRGWNAHGGPELLPAKPRYLGGDNYAFLDGHARWVKRGDASVPLEWRLPPAAGRGRGTSY